jgi:Fic family protein
MYFKLEKPDISSITTVRAAKLAEREDVRDIVMRALQPYRFWDEARRLPWPKDVTPMEGWAVIKHLRFLILSPFRVESVIRDEKGKPFSLLQSMPWFDDLLHRVDMELGGSLRVAPVDTGGASRSRLIARGVMEEAIASSQLEGAHVTRSAAKKMLREGRVPRTRDERMILNNYNTMVRIEREFKDQPLSLDLLFQMHAMLTEGTIEDLAGVGTFRDDEGKPERERIAVRSNVDETIYHMPPPVSFVRREIERLIAYANDKEGEDVSDAGFMHPVFKAILLHFWVGYLHPFVDGNGRFARALFYWYLLRHGYWAFAYIPLSANIKQSAGQYGKAYVYAEQDDNDLTYFIDYNLRQIQRARNDFQKYVESKGADNSRVARIARERYRMNDRQIQLVRYFLDKEHENTSLKTHMNIHDISRPTAIHDFAGLLALGFVRVQRIGRKNYYFGTEKIIREFA